MSYVDFMANLRLAKILLGHSELLPEGPRERAAVWLAPIFVFGFRHEQFARLGPDELAELERAVAEFVRVAESNVEEVTPGQYQEGAALLRRILEVTVPWQRGPEADEARIVAALEGVIWPAWVVNWSYELKDDHYGEPMVKATAFFEAHSIDPSAKDYIELSGRVRRAVREAGIDRHTSTSVNIRRELLELKPRAA